VTTTEPELPDSGQREARRVILWASRGLGYLVYLYILVVEVILLLGFFLLLFGANPNASFADWVYRSLDRVMEPFRGIFTPIELGTTSGNDVASVFETSVVFAMIIYGIVGVAVHALITWLTARLHRIEAEEIRLRHEQELERERELERLALRRARDEAAPTPGDAAGEPPPASPPPSTT
jgi:uncharacterized protein YggT (Ycf19 family)